MNDRLGPPPVERLSDTAWARIERDVLDRLDNDEPTRSVVAAGPRRRWPWLVAPVVLAAASAAVVIATRAANRPAIDHEPSRVVAGASPSEASFGDVHVTLDANSALVMDDRDGPSAAVDYGAAWFAVAPRGERPPFEVRAGDAVVRVIGTRFRVARSGEHTVVAVDHGVVEVRFHGRQVRLVADQAWSSEHPGDVTTAAPAPEPTIDPPATEPAIEPAIEIDPTKPTSSKHHPSHPASDPDRARYDALTKLEATHPDAALKGYLELSRGSGAWAEVALYAAGRLAVDHDDPRGRMLLEIYLRRFPSGANVADARHLLARLSGDHP